MQHEAYLHHRGLSLLYCVPRISVKRVKMIKIAASSGVGAMIVHTILCSASTCEPHIALSKLTAS